MARQPTDQKNAERPPADIHVSVDRSLFSFAIGQVKIQVSRTQRQSRRDELRERLPSACQDQVDWLLNQAHFTQRELYWACRFQALVPAGGRLRRCKLAWMDYILAAGFFVPSALLLLAVMVLMPLAPNPVTWSDRFSPPLLAGVLVMIMYSAVALFVWPQLTAKRAVRALEKMNP